MTKKISFAFISALLLTVMFSCKKPKQGNEIKNVTLDVSLAAGTSYQLDLSQYADNDDLATITTQATDFTTSEIVKDSVTNKYIYTFSKAVAPKTGSTMTDKVVLKVYEPAGRPHYDETNITINFTIL